MRRIAKRYTFAVTDVSTGVERRVTLPLWPIAAVVVGALGLPILIGMGARWSVIRDLQDVTAINIALRMENDSYRDATGQLVSQVSALQTAVDDIGVRAKVDPAASRAMSKLPAAVTSRAMGGGAAAAVVAPLIGGATTSTENVFNVLRDLLGGIESRLNLVRTDVERRQALAAATPSMWPISGWLTSPFGGRRDPFTGGSDFHPGLDIAADQGQPILAPADGTVSSASPNGSYGNLIVLDHGFGIVTKYGHLSRYNVNAGQTVKRGDVIGFVGTTGRSTSPHLHYEIWMNGRLTNPLRLLSQR